jgi:hypothetical protein
MTNSRGQTILRSENDRWILITQYRVETAFGLCFVIVSFRGWSAKITLTFALSIRQKADTTMNSSPISKTVVALLSVTGMVFAQDSPIVSPALTAKPGTILTVRINEPLSSDHNKVGDVFSATLTQPVIVLGIVVARYGQTAAGHVVEVKKAGKASGVSHLGITLTSLTLVDGQTVPIHSQLLLRNGPTSVGGDVAGIAGATGIGAAMGAVSNGGEGAAIGAAAGTAAGTIGVLLTRGDPAVVGPETLLTFEATAPVTIETNNAPQAFRFVEPSDYPSARTQSQQVAAYPVPTPPPYLYPYYYMPYSPPFYSYYYPYWGYPYFYAPSFSFFFGYGNYHYRGYPWGYGHVYASWPVPYRGGVIAHAPHGGLHR